jgi:phytanoyl-CoA hydroxylase
MSAADEAEDRRPGYRIHEPHSHSSAARRLYLHPRLHEVARLILGEAPVAIQSILFEYGSAQALHRDPVFVQTEEAGHLIAAWIALEDVSSDAGPLLYVPGSHTLPPYEFAPGVYRYDPKLFGEAQMAAERAWLDAQVKERSLAPTIFTAKKGEVLFWHAALYHGGAAIKDVTHKRRSFVVHYSTCRTHHTTAATVLEPDDSVRVFGTHRQIQDGRAVGFASPVATKQRDLWPTLRNRIAALSSRV